MAADEVLQHLTILLLVAAEIRAWKITNGFFIFYSRTQYSKHNNITCSSTLHSLQANLPRVGPRKDNTGTNPRLVLYVCSGFTEMYQDVWQRLKENIEIPSRSLPSLGSVKRASLSLITCHTDGQQPPTYLLLRQALLSKQELRNGLRLEVEEAVLLQVL